MQIACNTKEDKFNATATQSQYYGRTYCDPNMIESQKKIQFEF